MTSNPVSGLHYLWRGMKLLNKPGIRLFVLMPLLLNILVFSLLIRFGIHYFNELVIWVDGLLPAWLQWLDWLLWISFTLVSFVIAIYTFTFVANLIAAPFNGLLSEKVQIYVTGKPPENKMSIPTLIKAALMRQVQLLLYYLPRLLLMLILFLIPIVQFFAAVLWFLFNAWMMTLQYADFPSDNNGVSFTRMRKELATKRMMSLGFGTTTLFLTMIPFVNLFVIPAGVAGATLFWVEQFEGQE